MPCYDHLHDLSARETLCFATHSLYYVMCDAIHADQLLACVDRAGVAPQELKLLHLGFGRLTVLDQVMVEHCLALGLARFVEVDNFVDAVVDGRVELAWLIRSQNNDNFVGGCARAIQERVDSVTHVLRHVHLAAIP